MSKEIVTEQEKKLIRLLKAMSKDKDFLVPAGLFARSLGRVDMMIEFLESHPDATEDDYNDVLFDGVPPMEIVDDDDLDERTVYHG
jgi:hypothetical protein